MRATTWSWGSGAILAVVSAGFAGLPAAADDAGVTAIDEPVVLEPDLAVKARFGSAVSTDHDTLVVGAPEDDAPQDRSGSAWVYAASGDTWVEQARLRASDGTADDEFGYSVAVDGDTVLAGAPYASSAGPAAGAAYVFVRSGSTWAQQAELVPTAAESGDHAGWSVALQGNLAAVGVTDATAGNRGAVSIFTRSGTTWTETAVLGDPEGSDPAEPGGFGFNVALDGNTLVVGGFPNGGVERGAAYVYARSGASWTLQSVLTSGEPFRERDTFGFSADVDGDRIVIGDFDSKVDGVMSAGSAYVFERGGSSWQKTAQLTAPDPGRYEQLGYDVSVFGNYVAVSSVEYPGLTDRGAVFVFRHTSDGWRAGRLVQAPVRINRERFGSSVDVGRSTSGRTMVVGATELRLGESGRAYVYRP